MQYFQHLRDRKALLLDMNSTFMFGEDRFGPTENYHFHYNSIGGTLSEKDVNEIIVTTYNYLDTRYPDEQYRENFPSVKNAMSTVANGTLTEKELQLLVDTFAYHEIGHISEEYVLALIDLSKIFKLGLVIDIWSPKSQWINYFRHLNIDKLFSATSFSSDHGIVKPSPIPFLNVLDDLNVNKEQAIVIGDSIRRDLGGAVNAGIDCILVGGAEHNDAISSFSDLIAFRNVVL